ncbi:MAG: neutral/alkaline non-lysosomal ceramidase N-terminal domain-containing protein [Bacteroidales bacterium]|nr:neutral/alkaline non-lysosomal ceramidase N-terminal domain-containing protein [Bacteroidales bacterium]
MMSLSCSGPSLTCNFRSADISTTPDEHVVLAGFAARQGLSDGVHIPLRTSALAIRDGEKTVCIISNDLMEISPALADEIRDSISRRSGLARENILMHCIHTHSAPRTGGVSAQPDGTNYAYKMRTCETIVSNAVSVIADDAAYRAFRLETLQAQTSINRNRCEKGGPVDRDVYAVRFCEKNGKPICAVINLACHPVCLSHKSLILSSDYSGVARRKLAGEWGCEVFQLTGAAGNLDPQHLSADLENVDSLGTALADSLLQHRFQRVKEEGTLKFGTGVAHLPFRIAEVTPEAVRAHADSLVSASTAFPRFADDVRG